MIARDRIVSRLDEFLDAHATGDWGPNGLQVEGGAAVSRVVTGVTASEALILEAVARGAQMLVVHHGIFWNHEVPVLRGALLKRVRPLLEHGITLLAYHLPLDRHQEIGNSAPALRALGVEELEPFAMAKGSSVGWKGNFPEAIAKDELDQRVREYYGGTPHAFLEGPEKVKSLGLVSGGAQGELRVAIEEGLDAFITGEISEYNLHLAREEGIHHFSVGHHASECVGPRHLAQWMGEEFGLEAEFVDLPNPA